MVRYDSINELCPSDIFNDYILELSTCQVLDIESVYCDIKDITSTTTIQTVSGGTASISRRRRQLLQQESQGFDIYVLMQIFTEDDITLTNIIDRYLINSQDFAYQVDGRWKKNAVDKQLSVGKVMAILTGSDTTTTTPSPTFVSDILSTIPEFRFTQTGDEFIAGVEEIPRSQLTLTEGVLVVVGSCIVLCFCIICLCTWANSCKEKDPLAPEDGSYDEGNGDTNNMNNNYGNQNRNGAIRQINDNADEAENVLLEAVEEDEQKAPVQQHVIVEVDEKQQQQQEPEDSIQKVLSMNGYAEFEDSDVRGSQIALPLTPAGMQTHQYPRQQTRDFALQKGPVISQIQTKKVKIYT